MNTLQGTGSCEHQGEGDTFNVRCKYVIMTLHSTSGYGDFGTPRRNEFHNQKVILSELLSEAGTERINRTRNEDERSDYPWGANRRK